MEKIDISRYGVGDEIVVTVELQAEVVKVKPAASNLVLVLDCYDGYGNPTQLWADGVIVNMPPKFLKVAGVEKNVHSLPAAVGTIVKGKNDLEGYIWAKSAGDEWISLTQEGSQTTESMQSLYEIGSIEVV